MESLGMAILASVAPSGGEPSLSGGGGAHGPLGDAPHGSPGGGASDSTAVEPLTISCDTMRGSPAHPPRGSPIGCVHRRRRDFAFPCGGVPSGALLVPLHGTLHGALLCATGILWLGRDGDMIPMAGRLKPYG